ncbi:MAG: hypothetical protein VKN33_04545 [Candidatus Sericytochromatia bacterium]|nr:hypothetical protein [Candidatus Sericytochromatia bacterium]
MTTSSHRKKATNSISEKSKRKSIYFGVWPSSRSDNYIVVIDNVSCGTYSNDLAGHIAADIACRHLGIQPQHFPDVLYTWADVEPYRVSRSHSTHDIIAKLDARRQRRIHGRKTKAAPAKATKQLKASESAPAKQPGLLARLASRLGW